MYMWHEDERTLDTGGEQIKKDKEMNRWWATALILLMVCTCNAQQIVYSNLRELLDGTGDTLTTLQAAKPTKSQILLMNGGGLSDRVPRQPRTESVPAHALLRCAHRLGPIRQLP